MFNTSTPTDLQDRLFEAIEAGDPSAVRAAVKAGADPKEVRIDRGNRIAPLMEAFQFRDQDPKHAVIRALLVAGADPNIDAFVSDCIDEDRLSLAKLLLKHGADPDGASSFGERREESELFATLLIDAVRQGKPTFVKALLQAGADPNRHDDRDESALLAARVNEDKRCIKLLEEVVSEEERAWVEERVGPAYQAKVELDKRLTESMHAGDTELTLALIRESGRRLDTRLLTHQTLPLEEAFDAYLEHCCPGEPKSGRYLVQIEGLFDLGAPVGQGSYTPPIHKACHLPADRLDLFERMLASLTDPNVLTRTDRETALFAAVSASAAEPCRLLLERGIDPNHRDIRGHTALHIAREMERFEGPNPCVPVLLAAGAKE